MADVDLKGVMSTDDIVSRARFQAQRANDDRMRERITIADSVGLELQALQVHAICRLVSAIESIDMTLIDLRTMYGSRA